MSGKKSKIDPAYPSSDGLSKAGDAAVGVLGAAAGLMVPVVGPAAVQALLKNAVQLPLELRRSDWLGSLGGAVYELQDRFDGFDPSSLGENEAFVSAVAEATRIALATHRSEKLEALRNIVLNAAVGVQIDEVLHGAFLSYVDRFSTLHLRVLRLLQKPESVPAIIQYVQQQRVCSLKLMLCAGLGANVSDPVLRIVISDLVSAQLVRDTDADLQTDADGCLIERTTATGDAFLSFISPPEPVPP